MLVRELRTTLQHLRAAALRRKGRHRPVQRAARGMAFELVLEIVELVADGRPLLPSISCTSGGRLSL